MDRWGIINQLDQEYSSLLIQAGLFSTWNETKQEIHLYRPPVFFNRREIWFCSIGVNIGQEQNGHREYFERPVLIFKKFNDNLFLGFPLTSKKKIGKYYFEIEMPKGASSVILSQLRVLDAKRLNRKVRRIAESEYNDLFKAFVKLIS